MSKEPKDHSRKEVEETTTRVQRLLRYHRFLRQIKDLLAIDLLEVSCRNLIRLLSQVGELTEPEQHLYHFIIANLTAQTTSEHFNEIRKKGNILLSPYERERRGEKVTNSVTPRQNARNDMVYFVVGLDTHPNISSAENYWETAVVSLAKLSESTPAVMKTFWVSPHLSALRESSHSDPVFLGQTRYDIRFYEQSKSLELIFTSPDGVKKFSFRFDELIFIGKDVLSGLALQLIWLLRQIDSDYTKYLFATFTDKTLTEKEKIRRISICMTALMPGWLFCEGKTPYAFGLDSKYANYNNHHENYKYLPSMKGPDISEIIGKHLELEIAQASPEAIEKFNEMRQINNPTSLTNLCSNHFDDKPVLLAMLWILSDRFPNKTNFLNLLCEIIANYEIGLATYIMTMTLTHPDDSYIQYGPNLNDRELSVNTNAVLAACVREDGDPKILKLVLQYGGDITQLGMLALFLAANAGNDRIMDLILEQNFDTQIHYPSHSPLFKLIELNDEIRVKKLLKIGASPNICNDNGIPLIIFALQSHAIMQILINYNADLAPLHQLAHLCSRELILQRSMQSKTLELIEKHGVKFTADNRSDKYYYHILKSAVVIIVTGKYPSNDLFTIMGRRRQKNKIEDCYAFPGGFINLNESTKDAAIREFKEETGVDLNLFSKEISIREIFTTEIDIPGAFILSADKRQQIHFVHIDTGNALQHLRLWGQDDFAFPARIKLKDLVYNRERSLFSYQKRPIKYSNGLLLRMVLGSKYWHIPILSSTENVKQVLEIESCLKTSLHDAIKSNAYEKVDKLIHSYLVKISPRHLFKSFACKDERIIIALFANFKGESIDYSIRDKWLFNLFHNISIETLEIITRTAAFINMRNNSDFKKYFENYFKEYVDHHKYNRSKIVRKLFSNTGSDAITTEADADLLAPENALKLTHF